MKLRTNVLKEKPYYAIEYECYVLFTLRSVASSYEPPEFPYGIAGHLVVTIFKTQLISF